MLFVYTRHTKDCSKKADPFSRRCRCPKWLDGTLPGHEGRYRVSARTRSWEKAEELRRELEADAEHRLQQLKAGDAPTAQTAPVSVAKAVERFLTSKRNENLAESTLAKLATIFQKQFLGWCQSVALCHLAEITTQHLEGFRDTWLDGPLAKKKKQERLIGFFYYCIRLGWIRENPAANLGRIRVKESPTDYFPREEFNRIVDATYVYPRQGWVECRNHATRLRVLTWLLRWSGLAIRDAVTLERSRLNEQNELFLYRAKTGKPVYVPLPDYVAEALRNIPPGPKPNPRYFFWSGNGSPKSAVGDWQRSYRKLFEVANIRREDGTPKRCHPHMFRDTFAIEMLLASVPLDQVAILLGDTVKIVEKHYAPWVKARQEQLSANVRRAWQLETSRSKRKFKQSNNPTGIQVMTPLQ